MNDARKKAFWLSLAGFALGVCISLMFHSLAGGEAYLAKPDHSPARLLYFVLSGIYGAVNMGTSALYDIDEWSILRCTLTHFLISVGSTLAFFGLMIALGWMDMPSATTCALTGAAFLLIYFLIWLTQYLLYHRRVRNMNEKLRDRKRKLR